MAKIHMTLQGKGGVGKSTTAVMMAQYLKERGKDPLCIDTDPVSKSFISYKGLVVQPAQIIENNVMNERLWDALTDKLCYTKRDTVIDNGSTSFLPIYSYISSQIYGNSSISLVQDMGQEFFVHMPVAAGELPSCLEWMERIVRELLDQEPKFVVWLCPWQGAIEKEGKTFEEFSEYKAIKTHIHALVKIPEFLPTATHGRDVAEMLEGRLTFAEALEVRDFPDEDGNMVTRVCARTPHRHHATAQEGQRKGIQGA